MTESTVTITARSTDVQMVQTASEAAKQKYQEKSGREVEVKVEEGLSKDW